MADQRQPVLPSSPHYSQAMDANCTDDVDMEDAMLAEELQDATNFKSRTAYRWPILVLVSVVMLGSYYCYDNPAALNTYFTEDTNSTASNMPRLSSTEYNGLYTAYSTPNTVLPFFGGLLVDKLGCRVMLVMFTALLVGGQALFAFGASLNSYAVMMIGRVVYGFGGESLCVAAQTMLADWFMGREMAMAMGINLSVSRVGSVINDQTSVVFYKLMGLSGTLWIGVIIVGFSLVAAVVAAGVDRKVEGDSQVEDLSKSRCSYAEAIHRSFTATKKQSSSFAGSFLGGGSLPNTMTSPLNRNSAASDVGRVTPLAEEVESEEINLSDIKNFSLPFWLLCLACVVVYGTVLPFNNIASDFLSHKYYPGLIDVPKDAFGGNDSKANAVSYANTWMMVPFIISAVLSPFLGGIVDCVGQRSSLMLVSAVVLTGVHMFFATAPGAECPGHRGGYCYGPDTITVDVKWYAHPLIGLIFQGVAYSVYAAAIWPAVVYVVKPNQVGTAYGLITAVQNTGLAFIPLIVGALTKDTPPSDPSQDAGGYRAAEFFLVGCAVAGCVISACLLMTEDGRRINKRNPNE